jgi:ribosome-binding factor A
LAGGNRKAKLESLLKREIATEVTTRLRDPRLGFVTITRVVLSGDLQLATAYYTQLGPDKKRRLCQQALDAARGYIQGAYAPHLRTRNLPKLRFVYDEEEDRRHAMDELINRARSTDPDQQEPLPNDALDD